MELNIKDLLGLFLKRIWWILASAAIACIVFFAFSNYGIKKVYTSSASFLVSYTSGSSSGSAAGTDLTYSQKVVANCLEVLRQNVYNETLSGELGKDGIEMSASALSKNVTYTQKTDTSVFIVKVTTNNAETSKTIADKITETAPDFLFKMYPQPGNNVIQVKSISNPVKALSPESPNVKMYTLLGFLAGAIICYVVCLIIEMSDTRFKTEADLQTAYDFPVYGVIPKIEEKESNK